MRPGTTRAVLALVVLGSAPAGAASLTGVFVEQGGRPTEEPPSQEPAVPGR